MCREPDSDSILWYKYHHIESFLKGVEKWLGKDPTHSCSSRKVTRLKTQFFLTESSWAGSSKSCSTRGLLGPTQLGKQVGGYTEQSSQLCLLQSQWAES